MIDLIRTPFGRETTGAEAVAGLDLTGTRAVITGGTSGLGLETARMLAQVGAEVTITARTHEVGLTAAEAIYERTGNRPRVAVLELTDRASIADFIAGWSGPLHLLINNAGVMVPPVTHTPEGWEFQFVANHLGHFALTTGLHAALAAGGARVINVSSIAHIRSEVVFDDLHFTQRPYDGLRAYGQSKTANVLFTVEAARRWRADGITVNAVMPGGIYTGLHRHIPREELATMVEQAKAEGMNGKSVEQGAATAVVVATSPALAGISGRYFEDCNEAGPHLPGSRRGVMAYATDPALAERLWQVSEALLGQWSAGRDALSPKPGSRCPLGGNGAIGQEGGAEAASVLRETGRTAVAETSATARVAAPAEIPAELGRIRMTDLMTDPYRTLAAVRESCPAMAIENNGYRMWAITRYDDVRDVLANPTVLRDLVANRREINSHCLVRVQQRAHLPHGSRRSFFDRDGEHHRRLRGLVANIFTPSRLAAQRVRAEQVAAELLDGLPVGVPVDLAASFARPLAGNIVCELLGIPANEQNMLAATETEMITSPVISEIERAARELHEFARNLVAIKRAEPGDDLCTRLMHMHDEAQLSEDELISTYILLMVGGMEPSSAIGNGVYTLLTNPDQLARLLAEPELFPDAVEEIVRLESPFRFVPPRYTSAPVELDGVTIPAGELLLLSPAAANRDPAKFPDPDTFDVTRDTAGHLGFGHGPHRCLGYALGKIETATALRMLFERFPRTQLVHPPEQADWRPGKFMRRLDTLPVVLA